MRRISILDRSMQSYPVLRSSMPIGVFDSGVGGLSVLKALRAELPAEDFVYLADSGHAPYGEKGEDFVRGRSLAIARFLLVSHSIKALVVACNTATAAAVQSLRAAYPELPIIGVEPAIKPAALHSRTRHIGVMATRGTLSSSRFADLLNRHAKGVDVLTQACDGLALAIEESTLVPADSIEASRAIEHLCERYAGQLGRFGEAEEEIDTLVLGCTHYVFAMPWLERLTGPGVRIIETGTPVARYSRQLLGERKLLAGQGSGSTRLLTTGQLHALTAAAERWLGLGAEHSAALVDTL